MALNVKNLNTIKNVAKKSDEKSQILSLKIIDNENLIDYPRNNEDVTQTEDIQIAIRENGFSDPIEVTDYGMEPDKYMIVSGHRRRCAGVKEGMTKFPCIIRHFENEQNIYNYVLMSNSHRDSAKDPLLYCKRYKMHEEYLKESGFKGSIINEVAKRIGISPQQAERYNRFNKIIAPCWDLVRLEEVGMSSLLPMATLTQEEQMEVYEVIVQCIQNGIETKAIISLLHPPPLTITNGSTARPFTRISHRLPTGSTTAISPVQMSSSRFSHNTAMASASPVQTG